MKRYRVKLLERAKREYAVANAWWRTYRVSAAGLLRAELNAVRSLLARHPEAGRLDESRGLDIRRFVLPTVRYIVYYRVIHDIKEVQIIAFWHANREEPGIRG